MGHTFKTSNCFSLLAVVILWIYDTPSPTYLSPNWLEFDENEWVINGDVTLDAKQQNGENRDRAGRLCHEALQIADKVRERPGVLIPIHHHFEWKAHTQCDEI